MTTQIWKEWGEVVNTESVSESVSALSKQHAIATILDNQNKWNIANHKHLGSIAESVNTANTTAGVAIHTPLLLAMAKRTAQQLVAFDTMGVQPLRGPSGDIFALEKMRSDNQLGPVAKGETDTAYSGDGTQAGDSSGFLQADLAGPLAAQVGADASTGTAMSTAKGEGLGATPGTPFGKMSFKIIKTTATAKTRGIYADLTDEVRDDMFNVHGESGDQIVKDILMKELEGATDRESVRTVNIAAKLAGDATSPYKFANAGTLDLTVDVQGRMMTEQWKGLLFIIDIIANQIGRDTLMGKGNFIQCSANVASALTQLGVMDYSAAMEGYIGNEAGSVDIVSSLFAGFIANGRIKVIVDPWSAIDYITVGYNGNSPLNSGIIFSPYILWDMKATGEDSFQSRSAVKARYAITANPLAAYDTTTGAAKAGLGLGQKENEFYRKCAVLNLF